MSKGTRVFIGILIALSAIFAASSGFFYAKTVSLEKKLADKDESSATVTKTTDTAASATTTATKTATADTTASTATPVTASSTDSRPSSPSDTVVVAQGETLFEIGQRLGVSWTQIAAVNAIDANKIQVGQTLIVPKNNQVGFTVSKDKVTSLQTDVDSGKYLFRLSAVDTAKADSPSVYGLTATDTFVQAKLDENAGSATVTATKGDKIYTVTLVQPGTKGAKGIWAIESIKPVSN